MKRFLTSTFLLLSVFSLSGCLGPIQPQEKKQFTIALKGYSNTREIAPVTILVDRSTASPGYETRRMIFTTRPYEVNAFSKSEWAGPPAELLQPLIIQTLRDTGRFNAVVASAYGRNAGYLLKTHLLELRQDFTTRPSSLRMALQAEILNNQTRDVISSQVFSIAIHTPTPNPYGGVLAANRGTKLILNELKQFCIRSIDSRRHSYQVKFKDE